MADNREKLFKEDEKYRIHRLFHLSRKYGWLITHFSLGILQFEYKDGSIVEINYKDLKIDTTLNHPKWGKTTLHRSGELTQKIIESIFRNPRAHMPRKSQIKSSYQTH